MAISVWRKRKGGMTENSNTTMLEVISFQRKDRDPGHVQRDVSPEQSTEHMYPLSSVLWHVGYDKPSLSQDHDVQLPHSYCRTRIILKKIPNMMIVGRVFHRRAPITMYLRQCLSMHYVYIQYKLFFFFSQWLSFFLFPKNLMTFYSLLYAGLNEHGI